MAEMSSETGTFAASPVPELVIVMWYVRVSPGLAAALWTNSPSLTATSFSACRAGCVTSTFSLASLQPPATGALSTSPL
jgi:hypothetical protein